MSQVSPNGFSGPGQSDQSRTQICDVVSKLLRQRKQQITSVQDPEPKSLSASADQSPAYPTWARQKVFAPLDAARGLAALAVVAFHIRLSDSFRESLPTIHAIATHGYLGVPLFFVISGFCLAASAASSRRNNESALSFLKRRFRRIYPPLWCSMIVVAALP